MKTDNAKNHTEKSLCTTMSRRTFLKSAAFGAAAQLVCHRETGTMKRRMEVRVQLPLAMGPFSSIPKAASAVENAWKPVPARD